MALCGEGRLAAVTDMRPWVRIILAGVMARVAVVALSGGLHPQPLEPSVIAANLNAGRGFTFEQYGAVYRAWKEPLYIVLLAGLTRWAGQGGLAVVVFQSLFGLGAALGVFAIGRIVLGDGRWAMLAGVLAAVNPFLAYYDTQFIHPLSMDAFLFIAMVLAILWAVRGGEPKVRGVVWAGLVMGLALWQRASLFAAGLSAWLVAVMVARSGRRVAFAQAAALWTAVALVVISPWLLRNDRLFHRVMITTDTAHILWLGNNPWSNGTYSDAEGRRVFYLADPAFQRAVSSASELGQHDLFVEATRRFIAEQPARWGGLVLHRLFAFVWFSPNAGVGYTEWQRVVYRLAYAALLVCGALGIGLAWRRASRDRRFTIVILCAAVAGVAAVHAATAINMKHRVPLELLLSLFAAVSLTRNRP